MTRQSYCRQAIPDGLRMSKLLLDDDLVADLVHAVDLLCKLLRSLLFLLAGGEAAQLDAAVGCSNGDVGEFINRVPPQGALDLCAQLMIGHPGRYAFNCRTAEWPRSQ